MRTVWWSACLAIGLLTGPRLEAQVESGLEEGSFRIHKFKQPIGEERYRILIQGENRRLTTTFQFTDRGTPVRLDGALYQIFLRPRSPALRPQGKHISRQTRIDVAVDLKGGEGKS